MDVRLSHADAAALLGAFALDACDDRETAAVEAHLDGCETCAAEVRRLRGAASWLGASEMRSPPDGLRDAIRSVVAGDGAVMASAAAVWAEQIARLDQVLEALRSDQWSPLAVERDGWSVKDLVVHLAATDGLVAMALGLEPVSADREPDVFARTANAFDRHRDRTPDEAFGEWRDQAAAIRAALDGVDEDGLDRRVPWLGLELPLRRVLLARAFETWIHADDIRSAVGRPSRPPRADHMHRIADLAVRSLPAALRATGHENPGRTARVVLTGAGGGEWDLALGRGEQPGDPDVVLVADVIDLCLLAGGRMDPAELAYDAEGDRDLAAALVGAAPAFSGP